MRTRKVVLYISMSLDGFIATKDGDLSWLSTVEAEGEDYGYSEFNERVDTYIVGRKTYDKILGLTGGSFPQAEQHRCYVISRTRTEGTSGVTFYHGDIETLVNDLRADPGKDIYCDGGAQIVQLMMQKDLIDEFIISVIPIILGDGKRLFLGSTPRSGLQALPPRSYPSGLVQLHYIRINDVS